MASKFHTIAAGVKFPQEGNVSSAGLVIANNIDLQLFLELVEYNMHLNEL